MKAPFKQIKRHCRLFSEGEKYRPLAYRKLMFPEHGGQRCICLLMWLEITGFRCENRVLFILEYWKNLQAFKQRDVYVDAETGIVEAMMDGT